MSIVDLGAYASARPRPRGQRSKKTMRYEDVMALVERIATEQALAPGDLLPSQKELAERAGVSLITVRRALEELERVGRVRRHQGVGTFLARPRIISEPGRVGGLLETFGAPDAATGASPEATPGQRSAPLSVGSTVLSLTLGVPSTDLATMLDLQRETPVWQLRRLRHIDGRPLILETAIVPRHRAPDLDAYTEDLGGSFYGLLRRVYGITDASEEQYLEVIGAESRHRRELGLPTRAQVVRIRGLSYDSADVPFDCFEQVYPATDFIFAVSGSTTRTLLRGADTRDFTVAAKHSRADSTRESRSRPTPVRR